MEFTCVRCRGKVLGGVCEDCHATYLTRCPHCGNELSFEEVAVGDEVMLRCSACENDSDLQMVVIDQP